MSIKDLIDFIDRHTEDGAVSPREPWGEGIGIEEERENLVRSLSNREWLTLYEQLSKKSNFWLGCLIEILDGVGTQPARQMIIHLALNGTEENFFDAMECIRDFKHDVSTYTWLKLKNRSAEILRRRIKRK